MFGWLAHWLYGTGKRPDPAVLDKIVDRTDPRLRLLSGYERALGKGAGTSLAFCAALGGRLGEPLPLSLRSFTTDRRLGLFFSSPASLLSALEHSGSLSDFFSSPSLGDEAHALLLMQRTEKQRFGREERNGEVVNDVAQTVVSFDRHRIVLASPSRDALLAALPGRGLEVLLAVASRHLANEGRVKTELESELMHIDMKLATLAHPANSITQGLPSGCRPLPDSRHALEVLRRDTQKRLTLIKRMTELPGVLQTVRHILEHPDDYFRLRPARLALDRMGVLQPDGAEGSDITRIDLEEVMLGHGEPFCRAVVPVTITRSALLELRQGFGGEAALSS
ncbi:hypothetical protein [Paludibacterium paludis]|uniref:Uncharacterized protein n=1 Tax=Paludibacterium paludis TaxID=1225769 RepID=A0A918NYH1_9NEIS|nr:hypothetical protein [Paludibacterium paludis]GGY06544.1 hypothetical protein GCM10011289_06340 [Paludibacterium paludis]